jgi:uncharacterized protein
MSSGSGRRIISGLTNLEVTVMTRIALALLALLLCLSTQYAWSEPDDSTTFNAELAEELGADDYGMRRYVMAFLKAGPAQAMEPEQVREIQRGHMQHINHMAAQGKLVLAGPFMDGGDLRGLFVFAVDSMEEAEALTAADPAVQAGRLLMELRPWYGSAALMQVNQIHSVIARENP